MLRQYYLLLFFSSILGYQTYDAQYNIDLYRLKCESMAHRTLFAESKCHILSPDSSDTVYESYKEVATIDITPLLRENLIIAKTEDLRLSRGSYKLESELLKKSFRLIAIAYPAFCYPGAKLVGNRCFMAEVKPAMQADAVKSCAEKDMKLFYPHSDRDIKTIMELTRSTNSTEVQLGVTWTENQGWKSQDQFETDFFRWRGHESDFLYNQASQLRIQLHLQNADKLFDAQIGYMSVVKQSVSLPFVCVTGISLKEVARKSTTSTTTTTTTTTTTRPTTTITKLVCAEWTEWYPSCDRNSTLPTMEQRREDTCGRCLQQSRTRKILPGCTRGETYQMRNCYYHVCFFPKNVCEYPCYAGVFRGYHSCRHPSGVSKWDCVERDDCVLEQWIQRKL